MIQVIMGYIYAMFSILVNTLLLISDIQEDKVAHFGLSFGLTTTSYILCKNHTSMSNIKCFILSSAASLGLGIMKEYALDDKPDRFDLLADVSGVCGGVSFVLIEF